MSTLDPLLTLIRRVRTRWMFARAGWLFVATSFVVAVALVVAALTLRLVPLSIRPIHAMIGMAAAIVITVTIGLARRWPNDARVARHIDAALELRELIASGLASTGDDAASRMVRATASETARLTSPREVPESFPSVSAFAAAALLLFGSLIANSLFSESTARSSSLSTDGRAFDPTRRDPVSGGAVAPTDHTDALSNDHRRADAMSPTKIEAADAMPQMSFAPHESTGNDAAGGGRGDSDERLNHVDLTAARSINDSQVPTTNPSLAISASVSGAEPIASTDPKSTDLRAGASSPRIPDRGRSGAQSAERSDEYLDPSAAATHIPDRHRAIVRAYFDVDDKRSDKPRTESHQ